MSLTVAGSHRRVPRSGGTLTRHLGHGRSRGVRARARAQALVGLQREDLLAPWDVTEGADGIRVTMPVVHGMDLAQVAASRPPLSEAEVRWLGVRVANALAAMHGAGLAHGDVSPANVVLREGGITLVDTVGAEDDAERGTPGFRAPERVTGTSGPAQDVYALGRLLRWAVCHEDETSVRRWTAAWVATDAAARPSAAVAEKLMSSGGRERAVVMPPNDVAVAVRSRALERTERTRGGRWWRVRRRVLRGATVAAAVGAAVWLAVAVPSVLDAAVGAQVPRHSGESKMAVAHPPRRADPAQAATALTMQRITALASSDPQALLATVSGAGEVARAAAHTARQLSDGTLRYEDLSVVVGEAVIVTQGRTHATVEVAYEIDDHARIDKEGTHAVPAVSEEVEMDLSWAGGAWTVTDVRAP